MSWTEVLSDYKRQKIAKKVTDIAEYSANNQILSKYYVKCWKLKICDEYYFAEYLAECFGQIHIRWNTKVHIVGNFRGPQDPVQYIPVIVPEVGPPKNWHYKQ